MNMRILAAPILLACGLAGSYFVADHEPATTLTSYEVTADAGPTTTVRGQLVRVAPNGQSYPAAQLAVRVTHPRHGPSGFTYSQLDGMYYLVNVPASEGRGDTYVLEVWLNQRDALRFPNIVAYPQPFTDIAPIRVP